MYRKGLRYEAAPICIGRKFFPSFLDNARTLKIFAGSSDYPGIKIFRVKPEERAQWAFPKAAVQAVLSDAYVP